MIRRHKRNYLESIGAGEQDYVGCEICHRPANHIHHIKFRSAGGSDEPENLIALCEKHHSRAHGIGTESAMAAETLRYIANRRVERLTGKTGGF